MVAYQMTSLLESLSYILTIKKKLILRENRMVMGLGSQREESVLMHLSTIRFSFYAIVL